FDELILFAFTVFIFFVGCCVLPSAHFVLGVMLFPGCVFGGGVEVGAYCELRSHVVLEPFTRLGRSCLIHAHAVLGADGFGFFPLENGMPLKIPQIGRVVIGDEVELGAMVTVDRATLKTTSIGEGTKMDNHVHIGHNSQIGRFGLFAAGFMCAGSVKIGDYFRCGGDVVVADHVSICDHVTVGGRSAVTKDITVPGAYLGYPLEPWHQGLRNLQQLTHLTEMRKELNRLKKRLD
ncbi:MAG: UDP-3-O-(3-hydroxymyristoyl)glucosamine N-acyltransferase, partial [Bdellovibrionaceae bacterium]|nr:UDP-3-O-(3-hydroxymyristoyl)glucosamine N-acyltransferase [Pseudobdellovibrionaceae bacterium]